MRMDKFITFIGYLGNYIVPSRRNGNTERGESSTRREHATTGKVDQPRHDSHQKPGLSVRKDAKNRRFGNKNGGGHKGIRSGEDMDEAESGSKPDRKFLCGEVAEAGSPTPRCNVVKNDPKRFVQINVDNFRSTPALPPVDTAEPYSSKIVNDGTKAPKREGSAASPEKRIGSEKKQAILPSFNAAQDLSPDTRQDKNYPTNGHQRSNNVPGSNGLPDVFSTVGKPLVQIKPPSIYVPVRSKAATRLVIDPPGVDTTFDDWSHFPAKGGKTRLRLPSIKKKSKKKRNINDAGDQSSGSQTEPVDGNAASKKDPQSSEKGKKLSAKDSRCRVEENWQLLEEKTIEVKKNSNGNNESKQRPQRPGTAIGRWIKKKRNSVAPAPFDDLISDARDDGSVQLVKETPESNTSTRQQKSSNSSNVTDENVRSPSKNYEPVTASCRTVFISEKEENVSVLMVKEYTDNERESISTKKDDLKTMDIDGNDTVRVQEQDESNTKIPSGYEQEAEKSMILAGLVNMAEELTFANATSTGSLTKQSGLEDERLEKDSKRLCTKYNLLCGSQSYDGRRKSLINLEINSGPLAPPKVACKTAFVKQRVEMSSEALAEEIMEAAHASSTHREDDLRRFARGDSPPREGKPHIREQAYQKTSKPKKIVRFKAEPEILSGTTNSATDKVCPMKDDIGVAGTHSEMSSYTGHSWAVRKPSTFTQQFKELTNNDILLAGNNDSPLPIPEFKPKWHGGGPCLPSIRPGKTQIVDNFLEKHRRKMQREMEEDFEGWGEPEPNKVKRILGRPLSAKLPHYPANWDRLPKERPPERGGQGYFLGLDWNKPESGSFLSDASSEGTHVLHCSQLIILLM